MAQFNINAVAEVFLGSLPAILAIIGFLFRMDRRMQNYFVEHEILVGDYCNRKGIALHDLPTRTL